MEALFRTIGWTPKSALDIGGYKGTWTREFRRIAPGASVTIIEPNPHPELRTLGARVFYEVLSSKQETVPWYSNQTTGDSLYKERTRHYASIAPTLRTTTTLDSLFPTETFDFIKIDCQGAELDILQGGVTVLRGTEVLLLECPFAGQYNQNAPTFAQYIQTLDALGFAPLEVTEQHRAGGLLFQIDIVFLRKSSPLWERIQRQVTG
jgi:FkbM family methyltransferase